MTVKIVLVGGGGFCLELAEYLRADIGAGRFQDVKLAGFVDKDPQAPAATVLGLSYLGSDDDCSLDPEIQFLVALGAPAARKRVVTHLTARGASFTTYVHPSCYLAHSAKLAPGVIVCPGSIVNARAVLQEHVLVNVFCSVGHGATVGAYSVLSPYAALNGDASVGELCFLGTRATVFPRVAIGNCCTVDTHSFVRNDLGDARMVTNRGEYVVVRNRLC